jgi:DNA-binding response OmpR family regulator
MKKMSDKGAHVLVIDDNQDILLMLKTMLTIKGYRVSVRENIKELQSSIKELKPDVILMDMLLSGADGREVCKELRKNAAFAHIPIVMISAHSHVQEECIEAGADYFMEKPFDMNNLIKIVEEALK